MRSERQWFSSTYLCGELLKSLPLISLVTSGDLFHLSLWWPPDISSNYLCGDLLKSLPPISFVTFWNLFHLSLWWPPEIISTYLCGDLLKSFPLISVITTWNLFHLSLRWFPEISCTYLWLSYHLFSQLVHSTLIKKKRKFSSCVLGNSDGSGAKLYMTNIYTVKIFVHFLIY